MPRAPHSGVRVKTTIGGSARQTRNRRLSSRAAPPAAPAISAAARPRENPGREIGDLAEHHRRATCSRPPCGSGAPRARPGKRTRPSRARRSRRTPARRSRARPAPRHRAPDARASAAGAARARRRRRGRAPSATALYFERPARPSARAGGEPERPGLRARRRVEEQSRQRERGAGEREASSGPSGTTQSPAEAKKNGVTLSAKSAISAGARAEQTARQHEHQPAGQREQRDERQSHPDRLRRTPARRNARSIDAAADDRNRRGRAGAR